MQAFLWRSLCGKAREEQLQACRKAIKPGLGRGTAKEVYGRLLPQCLVVSVKSLEVSMKADRKKNPASER